MLCMSNTQRKLFLKPILFLCFNFYLFVQLSYILINLISLNGLIHNRWESKASNWKISGIEKLCIIPLYLIKNKPITGGTIRTNSYCCMYLRINVYLSSFHIFHFLIYENDSETVSDNNFSWARPPTIAYSSFKLLVVGQWN